MATPDYTVLDSSAGSLHKTSVIVREGSDALVVDAGFTRADGHRVVAALLDGGTAPSMVVITAGDPDFYFGAEVIADAFPAARFVAPADVIEHIAHSYEGKLKAWAHFGINLPTRLVQIDEAESTITVGQTALELRHAGGSMGDRGWYLFEPTERALIGGVVLFEGLHVWTADSATPELRAGWIMALDDLQALRPTFVVAGHRTAEAPTDLTAIQHTRDYLHVFEKTIASSADAAEAEKTLLDAYPNAGLTIAASLGTKVAKGEMSWG